MMRAADVQVNRRSGVVERAERKARTMARSWPIGVTVKKTEKEKREVSKAF